MCLTHGPVEYGFLSQNDGQMRMVGHQAVTPYLGPFFSTPVGYQIEIFLVIFVLEKNLL